MQEVDAKIEREDSNIINSNYLQVKQSPRKDIV